MGRREEVRSFLASCSFYASHLPKKKLNNAMISRSDSFKTFYLTTRNTGSNIAQDFSQVVLFFVSWSPALKLFLERGGSGFWRLAVI